MGMQRPMVRMLLQEHRFRPITGDVLLIGRQTVPMTRVDVEGLLTLEGVAVRPDAVVTQDRLTRGHCSNYVSDVSLFSLFTDATVRALDVSDYEGAEIVCDLNGTLPEHLIGRFDFVYNGSCLDNIWDPAASLRNMTRLLKPGGRVMHIEHATQLNGPYVMYSPDWFHDYYLLNGFADCKIYLAYFQRFDDPWHIYHWNPYTGHGPGREVRGWDFLNLVIAEKGTASTADRSPVQTQYRHGDECVPYAETAKVFAQSARPLVTGSGMPPPHSRQGDGVPSYRGVFGHVAQQETMRVVVVK
jgi:SAM-dependent methyltransferase